MIDKLRISLQLTAVQAKTVKEAMKSIGVQIKYINKARGLKMYFYNDMTNDYKIEWLTDYKKINFLFVEFNPCKVDKTTINVGTLTLTEIKENIAYVQSLIAKKLNIQLQTFLEWKIGTVETREDYVCKNIAEKELVLEALAKNDGGHLRRADKGIYWYNNKMAIKLYGKAEEVAEHNKGGQLPAGVTRADLDKIIRVEVELKHKKLLSILKNVLGKTQKNINLGSLLNPYILTAIFNGVMENFNLSAPLRSFKATAEIIKEKIKGDKMQEKLVAFVKFINANCVQVAKKKYGSKFYTYKDRLHMIGVNMLCLDTVKNIVFSIMKKIKHVALNLLQGFVKFFKIDVDSRLMYNIQTLFLVFRCFKIKIRL